MPDTTKPGDDLRALITNPLLKIAMDRVFEERRARLNAAIQKLDDELGDCDPAIVEAVERFVVAMWEEF